MAREAARFLQEAMREIDVDLPAGREGDLPALSIVPPETVVRLGTEKTVSVLALAAGLDPAAELAISTEPKGVVELLDGYSVPLQPHRRRDGISTGQIHLRPLVEGETLLTATIDGRDALALVAVRPPLDEEVEVTEPPEVLEFEHPKYTVRWDKRKRLLLRAPAEMLREHGTRVRVGSLDDGVAVLGGGHATLTLGEESGTASGAITVEGRKLGTKATLIAELGDETARCRVSVEQRDDGLPDLKIALDFGKKDSVYRAIFDPAEVEPGEPQTLKVYALHQSLRRYVGDPPDYAGQETPEWRAVLAEAITEAVARRVVERKFPLDRDDVDAQRIYCEHFSFATQLLPVMQKLSLG